MTRKTGKDYQKEFVDLLVKKEALETKVNARLLELCKQYPDAITHQLGDTKIKAESIGIPSYINRLETNVVISYIIKIEQWLADQHSHKQLEINFENKELEIDFKNGIKFELK